MEENPIHRQKAASYKEHMNILTCIHVYCADRRVDYVAKNRMTRFYIIEVGSRERVLCCAAKRDPRDIGHYY